RRRATSNRGRGNSRTRRAGSLERPDRHRAEARADLLSSRILSPGLVFSSHDSALLPARDRAEAGQATEAAPGAADPSTGRNEVGRRSGPAVPGTAEQSNRSGWNRRMNAGREEMETGIVLPTPPYHIETPRLVVRLAEVSEARSVADFYRKNRERLRPFDPE